MSRTCVLWTAASVAFALALSANGASRLLANAPMPVVLQDEVTVHLPLTFRGARLQDLPQAGTAEPGTPSTTVTATDTPAATATEQPTEAPTSTDVPPSPTGPPQPTATWQPPTEGIHGFVTFDGAPDAGLTIELQRTAAGQAELVATTKSELSGRYWFRDVPALPAGWTYGVRYANESDTARLSLWFGPEIGAFDAGDSVSGGDIDTMDVELSSPEPGATVSLPATFGWQRRGLEGDSYQWFLAESEGTDTWGTYPLGDVISYTVRSFTPPVKYARSYWWHVRVHRSGGYGLSHFQRSVLFEPPSHGIAGTITFRGSPAEGVALQLLRLMGNSWVQVGRATTNADGLYDFGGAPSLPQNAQYHVQYENLDDPERLSLWLGPAITLYGAGEAADGGSLDIADAGLNAPSYGASATLPAAFEWGRRGLAHDSYEWFMMDATTGRTWTSDPLGDVGTFELGRLMPGMLYGTEYWWYVRVHREGNGVGVSFMQFPVTLTRSMQAMPSTLTTEGVR